MASSRKPATDGRGAGHLAHHRPWLKRYVIKSGAQGHVLRAPLERALGQIPAGTTDIGVAVSGGPDSAMLAVQLALLQEDLGITVHVFHIHHGLKDTADRWCDHVHDLAHGLGLACHSLRTQVATATGRGIEAAARDARYQALAGLAAQAHVRHVVLAHHRDDQAETVLLRLLRGSGPAGLAAMACCSTRNGLVFVRPWLDVSRASIMQQVQAFYMASGWWPVYDPTNYEDAYTRSALRERLGPALDERWPGWQTVLARHARLAAQQQEILEEVAAADLAGLDLSDDGHSFALVPWRALSRARQAHVLRHWLATCGSRPPTQARLDDIMRQLRTLHALGHDRHMRVRHAGDWVGCHRGRVYFEKGGAAGASGDPGTP